MAGGFINQSCKGQEKIILIRTANKEFPLMQMWVSSTHYF